MKKVLLPIDFSEGFQKRNLQIIAHLKQWDSKCEVFLLNTYLPPVAAFDQLICKHDELRKNSIEKLEKERRALEKISNAHIHYETLSYMGSFQNVLLHVIRDYKIDYVVLKPGQSEKLKLGEFGCKILSI